MQSGEPFAKSRQAFERRFPRGRLDAPLRIEPGAEAQCLAPRIEPIDLVAFDAADLQSKTVRPEVDDGERSSRHDESDRVLVLCRRRLAETFDSWRRADQVSATLEEPPLRASSRRDARRLSQEDPDRQGLRRRDRVAARAGT